MSWTRAFMTASRSWSFRADVGVSVRGALVGGPEHVGERVRIEIREREIRRRRAGRTDRLAMADQIGERVDEVPGDARDDRARMAALVVGPDQLHPSAGDV